MQQLPKNGDHRKAFVPRKGHVFINGDFSGQEIGIMAAASNERIWIEAMLRGDDVHSLTASLLYAADWAAGAEPNCAFPKKCKCPGHQTPRDRAKGLNFMLAYGGGAEKFSGMTGLTLKEAKVTIARYKKVVRHVTRYLEKCAKETERSGESFSADPYRRRRFVPQVQRRYTIGKNNPIQAAGANMLKLSMISMPEEFPLVMIIHDQIILEVPKAKGKQAALAMKTVMEKAATYCTGIAGLIKVEPKITTNLYEK
jgi:DNA polymerase-1